MTRVAGILLAAGESRRMGGVNKLTLPVHGEALLRRAVRTLLASRLSDVVVVLGYESQQAERLLAGLDVRTVVNSRYAEGQMVSVHCGLAALATPADGIMICLADQPLLTAEDVDMLVDAFAQRDRGSILVPTYEGRRGNPIVIAAEDREAVVNEAPDLGCKRLIERHPERVVTVEMPYDHVLIDLDTPEDYARLQQAPALA